MIPLRDNIRSKTFAYINWLLILVNVAVFTLMLKMPEGRLHSFVTNFAVIPNELMNRALSESFTLVSATFVHGGWMHIISNMLFLHIFGDNVEDRMGHFGYLFFYLLAGVLANGTQALFTPTSMIPLVGASGAIAGVLGAYFFYYPHSKVLTLIPLGFFSTIREIPAFFFLGIWFLLQTFNGTLSISQQMVTKQSMGGVAWWAHAAGFIWGLLLSPIFGRRVGKYH